jgi:dethiobiotin synthetase
MTASNRNAENRRAPIIFVVGTDTGVGKTVLSLLLMQFFFAKGFSPFYVKPLQTGCIDPYDTDSDARFIYRHVEALQGKDPADSVIYCFRNPKAPLFAARDENRTIDPAIIEQKTAEKAAIYKPVIVEGAGGLLVPVTNKTSMADVMALTKGTPVIAARAGLGTINHTLLTIEALKARGIAPAGVVFIDAAENKTPPEMIAENRSAIVEASGVKVTGAIGRIDDFSHPPPACYEPLKGLFQF